MISFYDLKASAKLIFLQPSLLHRVIGREALQIWTNVPVSSKAKRIIIEGVGCQNLQTEQLSRGMSRHKYGLKKDYR